MCGNNVCLIAYRRTGFDCEYLLNKCVSFSRIRNHLITQ